MGGYQFSAVWLLLVVLRCSAILFPFGICVYLKTRAHVENKRRKLMMRRREIEEEIRREIALEKQNGTHKNYLEYTKDRAINFQLFKFW